MHSRVVAPYPLLAACALGCAAAACGTESQAPPATDAPAAAIVEFVDPPMWIGHQTVTHMVGHDPAGVTRVDLFLDDMRVAAVEFAPFDATWDATAFSVGPHTLRAIAYTSDGRTGEATTQVRIDHTEPSATAAATARRDEPFVIDARDDEAGVGQIVVQRGGATLATLTGPPYQFAWPGGACGNVGLHIITTDRVGNQHAIDTTVAAVDTHDLDCDGDPNFGSGGRDCDDGDPAYSSLAVDSGASIADLNCDGVPGVDIDRDGVPSIATGGTDCNDGAGDTHPAWLGWTGRALHLIRDGGGTYAPEFVALAERSDRLHVAFVANGTLYHGVARHGLDGDLGPISPEPVATGADDFLVHHPVMLGRFVDPDPAIVFFAAGELRVATRTGVSDWVITTVDPAVGVQLGRVDAFDDASGALHLIYEANGDSPSTIRYATNRGGSWSVQTLPEGQHAREAPRLAVDSTGRPHVIYETSSGVRHAVLDAGTWKTNTVFADNSIVSRYALGFDEVGQLELVAVVFNDAVGRDMVRRGNDFTGFALETAVLASVPERIEDLAFNRGNLVLQLRNRTTGAQSVQAWTTAAGISQDLHAGSLVGMTSSTSADLRVVVAAPGVGMVVAVRNRSVTAALDPSGGADLDCNGTL